MSKSAQNVEILTSQEYKYGFVTEIEADTIPPGLNEDIIRVISEEGRAGVDAGVAAQGLPLLG